MFVTFPHGEKEEKGEEKKGYVRIEKRGNIEGKTEMKERIKESEKMGKQKKGENERKWKRQR